MSETELNTYQLQYKQVTAALTQDPDNGELLKLKEDLEQVINLTKDLIAAQLSQQTESADTEEPKPSSSSGASSSSSSAVKQVDNLTPLKHWQVGEQCQALWFKDGGYYEATINEITTDGEVSVTFRHNRQQGVTSLGLLKFSKHGMTGSEKNAKTKEMLEKQKEYLKKKKQKKKERFEAMEKAGEKEKNKWQNFSNRAFGKKGFVKKSIFKTPENASGRVGIGTCGVSGKEMTKFNSGSHLRKGDK